MTFRNRMEEIVETVSENGISFHPIRTEDELAYALFDCRLSAEQQALVNPASFSIGRAYLNPDRNVPCLIRNAQGEPVGFILLCHWLGSSDAFSWSYYIDFRQQGKGYGKSAAALAVRVLKSVDQNMPIKLSAEAANLKAHRLYRSLGFEKTDELDGDDLVFQI